MTWVGCGRDGWWMGWVWTSVVVGMTRCRTGQRLLGFCANVCSLAGGAKNSDFERVWASVFGGPVIAVDFGSSFYKSAGVPDERCTSCSQVAAKRYHVYCKYGFELLFLLFLRSFVSNATFAWSRTSMISPGPPKLATNH